MGGREAIRGFAIQTLICLLDSLSSRVPWNEVTLEPDSDNDKVDIQWKYDDGSTCAQQVKSSKNQIGKTAVVAWCQELKASRAADKYQLLLAGPIASNVLGEAPFDGVEVPTPKSIDTLALLDEAITKVDRYLTSRAFSTLPLPIRESLIYELVARMLDGAIRGTKMGRKEFDGWLLSSITSSYPQAVSERLAANCAVLWSVIEIAGPVVVSNRAFELVLPLTVVNGGELTAVVEMFLLRIWSPTCEMRYRSAHVLPDGSGEAYSSRRRLSAPFGDFAIAPQASARQALVFVPVQNPAYHASEWVAGDYQIELFVKYASQTGICSVKRAAIAISPDDFSVLNTDQTRFVSVSEIDKYLRLL